MNLSTTVRKRRVNPTGLETVGAIPASTWNDNQMVSSSAVVAPTPVNKTWGWLGSIVPLIQLP